MHLEMQLYKTGEIEAQTQSEESELSRVISKQTEQCAIPALHPAIDSINKSVREYLGWRSGHQNAIPTEKSCESVEDLLHDMDFSGGGAQSQRGNAFSSTMDKWVTDRIACKLSASTEASQETHESSTFKGFMSEANSEICSVVDNKISSAIIEKYPNKFTLECIDEAVTPRVSPKRQDFKKQSLKKKVTSSNSPPMHVTQAVQVFMVDTGKNHDTTDHEYMELEIEPIAYERQAPQTQEFTRTPGKKSNILRMFKRWKRPYKKTE